MLALWGELEDRGGMIAFQTPVERMITRRRIGRCNSAAATPALIQFDAVVNAAGLGAQALARRIEAYPAGQVPRLVLGKGNYFGFAGRPVFSRLIYPTPIDGGLGVHVTLDLAGRMRFGPDVEWISEENYTVDPRRADFLRAHPHLLARSARELAGAELLRHPPETHRTRRGPGRFHDRWPGQPRPAAAGQPVRHGIAGADILAVDRRRGRQRFGLTPAFDADSRDVLS